MVVKGACLIAVQDHAAQSLNQGDCLLLPHGLPFTIASDLMLPPLEAAKLLRTQRPRNGVLELTPGDDFVLLGSHFDLGDESQFLLEALPPVFIISASPERQSIEWAVKRILSEMSDPRPGGSVVMQQVASTVLVDALRLCMGSTTGWLAALADPKVKGCIAAMHEDPAHDWTLDELARSGGMSRTAFAQRFKAIVGESPIAYLTRWRMTLAAKRVREQRESLATISALVGYQSESAFCAAFKRYWKATPRVFGRN